MRPPQLLPLLFALTSASQLPLVIWHGLGDTFDNPSLQSLASLANLTHPNTSTHIISLAPSPSSDRSATFIGHLPTQLSLVCTALSELPLLSNGFNAIGFSQGGQFLRGLIETCDTLPRVGTLVTFGSQHAGISHFLAQCEPGDWGCALAARLLESAKWGGWTQRNVVPAQYYRDPKDLESYLERSGWLADINNERPGSGDDGRDRKEARRYKERLVGKLGRLVMLMWRQDQTVVPRESAWFAEVLEEEDDDGKVVEREVRWLNQTKGYKEDWIGMRTMDEEGRLEFLAVDGGHMEVTDELAREIMRVYLGPDGKNGEFTWPPKEGSVVQGMEAKEGLEL